MVSEAIFPTSSARNESEEKAILVVKEAFSSLSGNKDIYILYIKSTIEVLDIVKCTVTRPLTLQGFILVHLIIVDLSSYIFSHRNRIKEFLAAPMLFLLKVSICPKFTQIGGVKRTFKAKYP